MSDLVERVATAIYAISESGFQNQDFKRQLAAYEQAKKQARAAMAIVLEEAATVAESERMEGVPPPTLSLEQITAIEAATKVAGKSIAKKIRKLGEE